MLIYFHWPLGAIVLTIFLTGECVVEGLLRQQCDFGVRLELLYHRRRLLSSYVRFLASLPCISSRVWVRGYSPAVFRCGWCGVQCTPLDTVLENSCR